MLVIQKKKHQIQPLDNQGPGSIQFPVKSSISTYFDHDFPIVLSHQGRPLVTPAPGMSASKAWMHM